MDWTEVVVALIGLLGISITAYQAKKSRMRANQAENEMDFQQKALSFAAYMEEWAVIEQDIKYLLENRKIDRFMILKAWNGYLEPKWTTAVYQMRLGNQEPVQYVHFELDKDYQTKLKEISYRDNINFSVEEIPDSFIKSVYQAEGVKHAAWFLIDEENLEGTDSKAITYCSFATHDDDPLDEQDMIRCQIVVGRLKAASAKFHGK